MHIDILLSWVGKAVTIFKGGRGAGYLRLEEILVNFDEVSYWNKDVTFVIKCN